MYTYRHLYHKPSWYKCSPYKSQAYRQGFMVYKKKGPCPKCQWVFHNGAVLNCFLSWEYWCEATQDLHGRGRQRERAECWVARSLPRCYLSSRRETGERPRSTSPAFWSSVGEGHNYQMLDYFFILKWNHAVNECLCRYHTGWFVHYRIEKRPTSQSEATQI